MFSSMNYTNPGIVLSWHRLQIFEKVGVKFNELFV